LPPKQAARRTRIAELSRIPATLVVFETGPRIAAALADLATGLGEKREAALCRELTKLHEEVLRGDLVTLAQACADREPRGEIVVVIAPPAAAAISATETESLLRAALQRVSLKDAVGEVASATGLPRREIYQRALALAEEDAGKDGKHGAPGRTP
jgi:16S rRNA (cytidine1402-2'-O)-methyltransferase